MPNSKRERPCGLQERKATHGGCLYCMSNLTVQNCQLGKAAQLIAETVLNIGKLGSVLHAFWASNICFSSSMRSPSSQTSSSAPQSCCQTRHRSHQGHPDR